MKKLYDENNELYAFVFKNEEEYIKFYHMDDNEENYDEEFDNYMYLDADKLEDGRVIFWIKTNSEILLNQEEKNRNQEYWKIWCENHKNLFNED